MPKKFKYICVALSLVLLVLAANIGYGHIGKKSIIERELGFSLPANFRQVSYHYFMGRFSAILSFEGQETYEDILSEIFSRDVEFSVHPINGNVMDKLDIEYLRDEPAIDAVEFIADLYPHHCKGLIIKTQNETILYVTQRLY